MENLNELAEEMVDRCPRCGSSNIRIRSAEVCWARCGFLFMNQKEVLRVKVFCHNCDQHASFAEGGAYQQVDLDPATVMAFLELRKGQAKKRRKIFGID